MKRRPSTGGFVFLAAGAIIAGTLFWLLLSRGSPSMPTRAKPPPVVGSPRDSTQPDIESGSPRLGTLRSKTDDANPSASGAAAAPGSPPGTGEGAAETEAEPKGEQVPLATRIGSLRPARTLLKDLRYNPTGVTLTDAEMSALEEMVESFNREIERVLNERRELVKKHSFEKRDRGDYVLVRKDRGEGETTRVVPPGTSTSLMYLDRETPVRVSIYPGEFPDIDQKWNELLLLSQNARQAVQEFFRQREHRD